MSTDFKAVSKCDDAPTSLPVIAFCIEELSVGGAEQMLVVLANEFVMRGWQVHMVCLTQAGELASLLDESVQLHVMNKRSGIDPGLPGRLKRCIDEIKPDVINSHLWVANAWTRLSLLTRDIPVVVTEHSRDTWKPSYYRWIDKQLARKTYRLVAVSHDTANFYEKSIGVHKEKIDVINNGVDTVRYANGCGKALRDQWLGSADNEGRSFLVGTVGRLVTAKNHQRLIDAVHLLVNDDEVTRQSDVHLYIVGEGPERSSIEQHIYELGVGASVSLMGARQDVPDVLAAFDVFVLSSDREGHPLTALEAQAAGTPVVLTDAGGSQDAIARLGDETGGELVSLDAKALSEAIKRMIIDPSLREKRARFARQFALENFDKQRMVDRYEALFRSSFSHS